MKFGGGTKAAENLESLNDAFFITAQGRDEDEESLRLGKRTTDARKLDVFHRNARTLLLTQESSIKVALRSPKQKTGYQTLKNVLLKA